MTRAGSKHKRGVLGCRLPRAVDTGTDTEQASSGDTHVDVRRQWHSKASNLQPKAGKRLFHKAVPVLSSKLSSSARCPAHDRAGPHQACGMLNEPITKLTLTLASSSTHPTQVLPSALMSQCTATQGLLRVIRWSLL